MVADAVTFTIVFSIIFVGLGAFLLKIKRDADRLEFRIQVLEQEKQAPPDTTGKNENN